MEMAKNITTSGKEFRLCPFESRHLPGVLDLWQTAFGKTMDMALWNWKYANGQFSHRILLGLDTAGAVQAMYGGIAYAANWLGRTVEIVQLVDIMTHPEVRKTGLFPAMAQTFFDWMAGPDKAVVLYGFPGQYHFDIGKKYLAYKAIRGGVTCLTVSTENLAARSRPNPAYQMDLLSESGSIFDTLWHQCQTDYPLAVIRDRRFMNWRFFQHPHHSYDVWLYRQVSTSGNSDPVALGYAVVSSNQEPARLLDILLPRTLAASADFFSRLGAIYQTRGLQRLMTWLPPHHFTTQSALAAGFDIEAEPLGIIPTARIFHPELTFDWLNEQMFYTLADADLF